jgi:hypothetical protein
MKLQTEGARLTLLFPCYVNNQGILKGGKYHCTIELLFDWFGLDCFANKNKNFGCHTADSKPVKQEANGTVILPPLVFPVNNILAPFK